MGIRHGLRRHLYFAFMMKRILLILLLLFVLSQFFQPDRTIPVIDPADDLLAMTNAPPGIRKLVIGACYDCHSYATDYPAWAYITPVNFVIEHHIEEGREHLNFSTWTAHAAREEARECGESIAEGEMPPDNYSRMHGHAQLSASDKQELIGWFNATLGTEEPGSGAMEEEEEERD